MTGVLDWPLTSGPAPFVLTGLGVLALGFLLTRRPGRSGIARTLVSGGVGAVVLTAATAVALAVGRPFPDPLPPLVWWSLAVCGAGIGMAIRSTVRTRPGTAAGAVAAAGLVLVGAMSQVNGYFDQYPTVGSLLGVTGNQITLADLPSRQTIVSAAPGQALADVWRPVTDPPAHGALSQVDIAGTASGFRARPAWVYLPPAYLTSPRAQLPVLVLLAGQPGSPEDWLRGGQLEPVMDGFAAQHHGLAPIVVIPDWTGSITANPLCLDSRLGRVQTYLSVDVPAWVATHLQADASPQARAVAGLSAGGTCALQLATNVPAVYPTFVSLSGQSSPTLGDPARTVQAAFGGDTAAFRAVDPLERLARQRYPHSAGFVTVGAGDTEFRGQARDVVRAAQGRMVSVQYREIPGRHDWTTWRLGLHESLPWLGSRLHLTASPAPAPSGRR